MEDPFALPVESIENLFRYKAENGHDERVHVTGTVTYHAPGERLVLQDGPNGLLIESNQNDALQLGDRVEAVGFPKGGSYSPRLVNGQYRRLGSGLSPQMTLRGY